VIIEESQFEQSPLLTGEKKTAIQTNLGGGSELKGKRLGPSKSCSKMISSSPSNGSRAKIATVQKIDVEDVEDMESRQILGACLTVSRTRSTNNRVTVASLEHSP